MCSPNPPYLFYRDINIGIGFGNNSNINIGYRYRPQFLHWYITTKYPILQQEYLYKLYGYIILE